MLTMSGTELAGGSVYFRVSRYVDNIVGQSSTATSTANTSGVLYTLAYPYFDQKQLISVDSTNETFVLLGRSGTTGFQIHVLYQSAV